jgi:hypothetical protein
MKGVHHVFLVLTFQYAGRSKVSENGNNSITLNPKKATDTAKVKSQIQSNSFIIDLLRNILKTHIKLRLVLRSHYESFAVHSERKDCRKHALKPHT